MINEQELKKERDYLHAVLYILEKEIKKKEETSESLEVDMRKEMRYVWENNVASDAAELHSMYESVKQMSRAQNDAEISLKTYRKMIRNAYFARIDFDDGSEVFPIYLGIATLKDGGSFYVYDWRAPICSMFYDYQVGDASYTLPDGGEVSGKIILKRQYKLEGDKIIQIFDTDMEVLDDILSSMLTEVSRGATKMKNIVATIQKEQNKAIRREDVDILVVQGPAGSGKTSVAMHKAAYLLYSNKGKVDSSNILIISPNEVFSDYISDVLPQIGEDNVYQTTYMDFVKSFIKEFKIRGTMDNVYEEIFTNSKSLKKSTEALSIKLKFWPGYIRIIESLIEEHRRDMLYLKDIVVENKLVVSKDSLEKFASDYEISGLPIVDQAKIIGDKIKSFADVKFFRQTKIKQKLSRMLQSNINQIKVKPIYLELYSNLDDFTERVESIYNELGTDKRERLSIKELKEVFEYTRDNIAKNYLPYEDVTPYMYFRSRVFGSPIQKNIKYVLIDECQDYTLTQYNVISSTFRGAKVTLLGDINQSIFPYSNFENYEPIINMFKRDRVSPKVDMTYLTRTYRSTFEINNFALSVLGTKPNSQKQVERHGDKVEIIKDVLPGAKSKLLKDAVKLKEKYSTVAVIFKTEAECKELQKKLVGTSYQNAFKFIMNGENDFSDEKVMIIPLYIAKGLEFDAALIARANEDNYSAEDKKLFYVASTRAMNKLNIYYDDIPSSLIVAAEV